MNDNPTRGAVQLDSVTLILLAALIYPLRMASPEELRIATYNLRNYRQIPSTYRPAKSPVERIAARRVIQDIAADVIALQEVGHPDAISELVGETPNSPRNYAYAAFCQGSDSNNFLATLSRAPIIQAKAHDKLDFLLYGRKTLVSRGFLETRIQTGPRFQVILVNAHLKSKSPGLFADDDSIRREEAILLFKLSQKLAREHPSIPQIIVGDLNDTPDSAPLRILTGKNRLQLLDIAPLALSVNSHANWTFFYPKAETYSRVDYVLLDSRLQSRLIPSQTFVLDSIDTQIASDHRPVVATLEISSDP